MGIFINNKNSKIVSTSNINEMKTGKLNISKIRDSIVFKIKDELIYTSTINNIMTNFFIEKNHIEKLYKKFKYIDISKCGYLKLQDLFYLINERPNKSIISPFLENFFKLIEKQDDNRISFEEFLPYLISYCIYTQNKIKEFVFNILDTNNNACITKNQIIRLFSSLGFSNFTKAIREYKNIGNDQISLEQFIQMCDDLPFIHYPAMKLQSLLRINYLGENFWIKLQAHISKNYKYSNYVKRKPIIDKKTIDKINIKLHINNKNDKKIYEIEKRIKDGYLTDTEFYIKQKKTKFDLCNSLDVNIYN